MNSYLSKNCILRIAAISVWLALGSLPIVAAHATPTISVLSVSATEQVYLPTRNHLAPPAAYRSPMEVPPATIKAGWNAYFVTNFESYNCPAPWSLLDSDAVKNASPHYCTQILAPEIDDSALPSSAGVTLTALVTTSNAPWKRNYSGVFSVHLLPQPDGIPAIFAITHGENKGESPTYAGPGTGFFSNTFLPGMTNKVTPTMACLEQNGCYFATVNLAQKPFTANTNWAQMPFQENGPITWPAAGYIGGKTINNGISSTSLAKNTKVSEGPRHPSSIVATIGGIEYMYVFYQDWIYIHGIPNNGALNTGNTRSGMKVIRATTANLAPGNWKAYSSAGFVDPALPVNFSHLNMKSFLNIRGPRTEPLFANQMVPTAAALYETERFSVAKVRGTNTYIGVEWYTEYRGQGGANCKDINGIDVPNLYKLALRVSSDLVNWTPRREIYGCLPRSDFKLAYPIFLDKLGESNYVIDQDEFYIIGTSANVADSTPGSPNPYDHSLNKLKLKVTITD